MDDGWLVGLAFVLLGAWFLRHDVEDGGFWFRWMRWRRWDVVMAALAGLLVFAYVGGIGNLRSLAEDVVGLLPYGR